MIGRHCKGRRVSYVHNGGVRVEQFGEGEGDLECGSGFSELLICLLIAAKSEALKEKEVESVSPDKGDTI